MLYILGVIATAFFKGYVLDQDEEFLLPISLVWFISVPLMILGWTFKKLNFRLGVS